MTKITNFNLINRCLFWAILIFLLQSKQAISQEKIESNQIIPTYKKSIKGFAFAFPEIGISPSMGIERKISKHSAIGLSTYYRYFLDEMSLKYHSICLMPEYKYYAVSDKKIFNDLWIGAYLSYLIETHIHPRSDYTIRHSLFHYGLGLSIGKRVNLNKNHRLFLDIGFGLSYNYYSNQPNFVSGSKLGNTIIYRPIIKIGWKY